MIIDTNYVLAPTPKQLQLIKDLTRQCGLKLKTMPETKQIAGQVIDSLLGRVNVGRDYYDTEVILDSQEGLRENY